MTSDITEEQLTKNQLRSRRYDCLKLAIDSKVDYQDGKQLIDTAKKIYEFFEYEDK